VTLLADRTHGTTAGTGTAAGRSAGPRWWLGPVALAVAAAYAVLPGLVRLEGAPPRVGDGAGLEVSRFGTSGSVFLRYQHDGTTTVTVPLHNPTALPVAVDAVTTPSHPKPLLSLEAASEVGTVPPFATRPVHLTFRYGNCRFYHERAAQTVDRLVVTGSVLGRGFSDDVPLAEALVVHGQVILDCPDRTLVRGDDVR